MPPPFLPAITAVFQSGINYTWIGAVYFVFRAASTPIWGALAVTRGHKTVILVVVVTLILGSAMSGFATRLDLAFIGRSIQGVGASGTAVVVGLHIVAIFDVRFVGYIFDKDCI